MIEILSEAVDRHDHPVCVAAVTRLERWIWLAADGFLSKRHNPISERASLLTQTHLPASLPSKLDI